MEILLALVAEFLLGVAFCYLIFHRKPLGTVIGHHSDEDGPYIFLEFENAKDMEAVLQHRRVTFRVKTSRE